MHTRVRSVNVKLRRIDRKKITSCHACCVFSLGAHKITGPAEQDVQLHTHFLALSFGKDHLFVAKFG